MKKRFVAFWLSIFATLALLAIPAAATSEPEPPTHTHTVENWTAVEDGHSGVCADCGETVTQAHNMGEGTVTLEPTCQAEGKKTYTCICGHSYDEPISKLTDHVCNQWTPGETQHTGTCIHCGTELAAEHSYGEGTVTLQPTCTADGEKTLTCTICGHTTKESVPRLNHTYGKWESVDGNYHKHSCACGHTEQASHTWNSGVITRYPSCDQYGIKTYTCTGCGVAKHVQTYRSSHKYYNDCDITCNYCGFIRRPNHNFSSSFFYDETNHWHECTVCHIEDTKDPHIISDWIVDVPPGEYTDGKQHKECTICGMHLQTESIPATGCLHGNEELRNTKDPTCSQEGYTGDWVCPRCDEVVIPGEPIPTLPHQTVLENQKEPTCIFEGYTGDWVCSVCDSLVAPGEPIPTIPHNPAIKNQKEPTCTQKGYTGDSICQDCLAIISKGESIPLTPHNTAIENQKEPTCTQEGYSGDHICQDCRAMVTEGETVSPVPHQTQLHGAKEPGCVSDGYTGDQICKYCMRVIELGKSIPHTGHRYAEGFCRLCGAIDPEHVFPEIPPRPTGSDTSYEPLPMSPMIIAAMAMLAVTGIGIVVLIVLVAKKK